MQQFIDVHLSCKSTNDTSASEFIRSQNPEPPKRPRKIQEQVQTVWCLTEVAQLERRAEQAPETSENFETPTSQNLMCLTGTVWGQR